MNVLNADRDSDKSKATCVLVFYHLTKKIYKHFCPKLKEKGKASLARKAKHCTLSLQKTTVIGQSTIIIFFFKIYFTSIYSINIDPPSSTYLCMCVCWKGVFKAWCIPVRVTAQFLPSVLRMTAVQKRSPHYLMGPFAPVQGVTCHEPRISRAGSFFCAIVHSPPVKRQGSCVRPQGPLRCSRQRKVRMSWCAPGLIVIALYVLSIYIYEKEVLHIYL